MSHKPLTHTLIKNSSGAIVLQIFDAPSIVPFDEVWVPPPPVLTTRSLAFKAAAGGAGAGSHQNCVGDNADGDGKRTRRSRETGARRKLGQPTNPYEQRSLLTLLCVFVVAAVVAAVAAVTAFFPG